MGNREKSAWWGYGVVCRVKDEVGRLWISRAWRMLETPGLGPEGNGGGE